MTIIRKLRIIVDINADSRTCDEDCPHLNYDSLDIGEFSDFKCMVFRMKLKPTVGKYNSSPGTQCHRCAKCIESEIK